MSDADIPKDAPRFITDDQVTRYRREGYVILPGIIAPAVVEALRQECDVLVASCIERKSDLGMGDPQRHRHHIANRHPGHPAMSAFLRSDLMLDLCRALLGPEVFLFYEQLVVKGPERGAVFDWHQDSGYVDVPHPPYLTLWCALDEATVENGTVWILPRDRAPSTGVVDHPYDEVAQNRIGYAGPDPGEPALCPAGSIVAFSSLTFHRSGCNRTSSFRRAYVCQYSPEPMGHARLGFVEPLLRGGRRVRSLHDGAATGDRAQSSRPRPAEG